MEKEIAKNKTLEEKNGIGQMKSAADISARD